MKLFINYRREDTDDLAGRLCDRLLVEFGGDNIFKDTDSIRGAQNWKAVLEQSVAGCDIVLALIGKNWATCTADDGRVRLHCEEDWVRYELECARRGKKLVMPVLVKGASIPKAQILPESIRWLLDIQVTEVRGDPHFKDDVTQLINELRLLRDRIIEEQRRAQEAAAAKHAKALESNAAGVVCPTCRQTCPRSDQFCEFCGASLWDECPKCNANVPASQRFCRGCGVEIPKYREALRIVEGVRSRHRAAALEPSSQARFQLAGQILNEVDSALRIVPDFEAAALLRTEIKSLGMAAAMETADAAYSKNRYSEAIEAYEAATVWGTVPPIAGQRLSQIRDWYENSHKQAAAHMAGGNFAEAAALFGQLESRFPGDPEAALRAGECRNVIQHADLLLSTRIRELKYQRKLIELEKEISWMEQKHIKNDRLPEFAKAVRKCLADSDARFARAKAALNAGQIEEAVRLAKKVGAYVADHQGAQEILSAARSGRDQVAQLVEVIRQGQWCAALNLLKNLDTASLADSRVPKLKARVTASIASLDSSITFLLATAAVGIAFAIGLLPALSAFGVQVSSRDAPFVLCCTWAGVLLMVAIVFLTLGQRQQVVSRFKMYFIRTSRPVLQTSFDNDTTSLSIGQLPALSDAKLVVPDPARLTSRGSPATTDTFAGKPPVPPPDAPSLTSTWSKLVPRTAKAPDRQQAEPSLSVAPIAYGVDGGDQFSAQGVGTDSSAIAVTDGLQHLSSEVGVSNRVNRSLSAFTWMLTGGVGGAIAVSALTTLAPSDPTYPWLLVFIVFTAVGLSPAVLLTGGRSLARLALAICGIGVAVVSAAAIFGLPRATVAPCFIGAYIGLGGASLVAQSLGQKFWKGSLAVICAAIALIVIGAACIASFEYLHAKDRTGYRMEHLAEDTFCAAYLFSAVMAVLVGIRGFWKLVLSCCVSLVLWFGAILIFQASTLLADWILFVIVMQVVIPLCTWKWRADLLPWGVAVALLAMSATTFFRPFVPPGPAQTWVIGWELLCCTVAVVLVDLADVTRNHRDVLNRFRHNAARRMERVQNWLSGSR